MLIFYYRVVRPMKKSSTMQPIQKKRTYELVVEQIKELLSGDDFKPGDRLPTEQEIASTMGVSRATVREAMIVLERSGLVEICPGRGIVVCEYNKHQVNEPIIEVLKRDGKNVLDLLDFRKGIEVEAAYLAAVRINKENQQELRNAYKELKRAVQEGALGAEEDRFFHRVIAHISGNHLFERVMDTIEDLLKDAQAKTRADSMRRPGQPQIVLKEHERIMNAIIRGDGDEARNAMRVHLDNVAAKIHHVLKMDSSKGR